ncbi:hypothetical protein [Xanthocytophaga agilis]|uniref:Uncharacterized protein n=1 Tax=Xanthocytophaga agilis TaxID=3048010 RepID=A0AAE3RCX6_9BACT|nr:hypothetical protein [Xanthocytophaga agilis]MDJ1506200.1 hypothetical protein [Xanthocytophaga agilis]
MLLLARNLRSFLLFVLVLIGVGTCNSLYAQTSTPDTVRIGCYLLSLHDLDFREQEYTARFWVWMVYNKKLEDLENSLEIANAKEVTVDEVVIDSLEGKKWVQFKLKCIMKENWAIQHFPFDRQRLQILVENSKYDQSSLIFMPDTSGKLYDPDMTISGWKIRKTAIEIGTSEYKTGFGDTRLEHFNAAYSQLAVVVDVERNAWGLFFKLFLGMYVAFAIAYVTFFIDAQHADARFGLPVGGLFAAVGNKYVIDGYLPFSSQLTIVDILHGATFLAIFFTVMFSVISLRIDDTGKRKQSQKTDRTVGFIILGIYGLINCIMLILSVFHIGG